MSLGLIAKSMDFDKIQIVKVFLYDFPLSIKFYMSYDVRTRHCYVDFYEHNVQTPSSTPEHERVDTLLRLLHDGDDWPDYR